jgi:hypothetical protein
MPTAKPALQRPSIEVVGWGAVSIIVLLIPWLRNREYIRDFFDYGLMMTAAGRINGGDRPFVDFSTPLQSGSYWLNAAAEWLWGPTFQSLTLANGVFIVVAWLGLVWLLRQVVTAKSAMLLATTLVAGSASQHTIIWYNAIGVIAIAVVAIGVAKAPVWSRDDLAIHVVVILALIFSGINKLNFHAIALVAAIAWTLRAALVGQSKWSAALATIGTWMVAGLLLPLLIELGLTGASWQEWKSNVILMPFADRGATLSALLSPGLYLRPMHDYYGPVFQPVGLIVAMWVLLTAGLAWPRRSGIDRLCIAGSAIFVVAATGALMVTNHEIVYVSLAAGIAMLLSMWVGFDLAKRPRIFIGGMLIPAGILGVIMLHSAWMGHRSQFGHSPNARDDYQELSTAEGEFMYLSGTKMPPELAQSLLQLREIIPAPDGDGLHACLYLTGAEYLERIWPTDNMPKMPLLFANLTIPPEQLSALEDAISYPPRYELLIGSEAWAKSWPGKLRVIMKRNAMTWNVGLFQINRLAGAWLQEGLPPHDDAIAALGTFGGNMDPGLVVVEDPLWPFSDPEERILLATDRSRGSFLFPNRSNRISGEVALRRAPRAPRENLSAVFAIYDAAMSEGEPGSLLWTETLALEPEDDFKKFSYQIDSRGHPTRFVVLVDEKQNRSLQAGYYLPSINHSDATPRPPPTLRKPQPETFEDTAALSRALLPKDWQGKFDVVGRGIAAVGEDVVLTQGGQLWLRPKFQLGELHGQVSLTAPPAQSGAPVVRIVWYRGGRMHVIFQSGLNPPDQPLPFRFSIPEDDGWFGIHIDPSPNPHGLKLEINSIKAR